MYVPKVFLQTLHFYPTVFLQFRRQKTADDDCEIKSTMIFTEIVFVCICVYCKIISFSLVTWRYLHCCDF